MTEFIDHCWNDKPDVALIGMCTSRQSERWIGKQLAVGLHEDAPVRHGVATLLGQLHLDDPQDETEHKGPSLQNPSKPVPILEQAQASTFTRPEGVVLAHLSAGFTAAQIADHLGVSHKTTENHTQRMSFALRRCVLDQTCALVSPSGRSLPSA
jgi:DNA-binding NarL/FixJ family response regulator